MNQISSPHIQAYANDVLLNPKRNLPVIMVSPDVWNGRTSVDASAVFARLKGFAHVTVLADKWAAFKLTDVIDKPLSCYAGAVRIYWPGFRLDDNPFQHRLFLPHGIRYYEAQGLTLHDHLFRTLAAVASFRYTEGAVIRAARHQILDDEKRKLGELREHVKAGHVEKEKLESQLLESLAKIDQISAERNQLKEDLAAQQAAWAEVQQAMVTGDGDASASQSQEGERFATVLDAVKQAKQDFSGPLDFLDSAIESAKDSPYKNPDRVYELFEALHLVAAEWKENNGRLGCTWAEAMDQFGFDVRDQISQTSKGKWGDQYRFFHKGHKQLFERHITIGAKQPAKCLSVHWYRDDDDLVLSIGHCGRHLTNTSA